MTSHAPATDPSSAASQAGGNPTACIVLDTGQVFYGYGFGLEGTDTAELCFNTAMTGYQEIMTDPSYAGQVVTFTFPAFKLAHNGNFGRLDEETGPDRDWRH